MSDSTKNIYLPLPDSEVSAPITQSMTNTNDMSTQTYTPANDLCCESDMLCCRCRCTQRCCNECCGAFCCLISTLLIAGGVGACCHFFVCV